MVLRRFQRGVYASGCCLQGGDRCAVTRWLQGF